MRTASLRKSGGSYIVTVPQSFVEQNNLTAGAPLLVEVVGDELRLKPKQPKPTLAELLSATPKGLHRIEGWDEMPDVGTEL
jgi:antitoxin ChpS